MQFALQLTPEVVHVGKYNAGPGPTNRTWSELIAEEHTQKRKEPNLAARPHERKGSN